MTHSESIHDSTARHDRPALHDGTARHDCTAPHDGTAPHEAQHEAPDASQDEHGARTADWIRALDSALPDLITVTGSDDGFDLERSFAAVVWSSVAEPGDLDAGAITRAIGLLPSARLVVGPDPVAALCSSLRMANGHDLLGDAPLPRIEAAGDDRAGAASSSRLVNAVERWRGRLDLDRAVGAVRSAARVGARLVVPGGEHWPTRLDDLGDGAPHALWVRGSRAMEALAVADRASVAIVGSRAATNYGESTAIDLADGLASQGYAIVSGGAFGIDVAAHRSALAAQTPTIAILAGGADRLYPHANEPVFRRILDGGGAVLSELPCGQAPTRWRFLLRNRVIAAMAQATVVVEAGIRSGALNTAGHAAELGRPLGAVPGPVTSAASRGCHRLIREFDATLVSDATDVLELVGGLNAETSSALPGLELSGLMNEAQVVLDALSPRARQSPTEIAVRAGLAAADVRGALAALELDGRAEEIAGRWRRTPN